VAGTRVTRAAIHQVETGRARPSRRTLALIASRTGKPLEFFLEAEAAPGGAVSEPKAIDPRLAEIESLLASSRFRAALPLARKLLSKTAGSDPAMLARVRLRLAQAQVETGDAPAALEHLRAANDFLAGAGETELLVECLDARGLALKRLENPDAMATYNEALRLCRQARGVRKDLEARILGHIGAAYTSTHDWDSAVRYYEMALEAAGNLRDLSFLERMYNDIGLAEMEARNLTSAFGYFQKALTLAEVANEPPVIARLENNIGWVLVGLGELDSAEAHLGRSLEICESIGLEVGRGHVMCSLAELAIARRDAGQAEVFIKTALEVTSRIGEKLTEADALQLAGQVAEMRNQRDAADDYFERALAVLREQGASQRLMECHVAYATILEERGDPPGALAHTNSALLVARPQLHVGRSVGTARGRATASSQQASG